MSKSARLRYSICMATLLGLKPLFGVLPEDVSTKLNILEYLLLHHLEVSIWVLKNLQNHFICMVMLLSMLLKPFSSFVFN
jgi:hypothetical protein